MRRVCVIGASRIGRRALFPFDTISSLSVTLGFHRPVSWLARDRYEKQKLSDCRIQISFQTDPCPSNTSLLLSLKGGEEEEAFQEKRERKSAERQRTTLTLIDTSASEVSKQSKQAGLSRVGAAPEVLS